jgi:hypothetical protein
MAKDDRPKRQELLPDIDPDWVKQAITKPEEAEPEPELDPDDPDSVWLLGNDPEAEVTRVADQRNLIRKQMLSSGGQFVMGIVMMFVALGLVIMAITNPVLQYIIPAAIIAPISLYYMRVRWRRWLGSAPYFYRLMTSLGEDAENILVDHEQKKRDKYVDKIGDLYAVNTNPKKKKKR